MERDVVIKNKYYDPATRHSKCPGGFHPAPGLDERDEKGRIKCVRNCRDWDPRMIKGEGGMCRKPSQWMRGLMDYYHDNKKRLNFAFDRAMQEYSVIYRREKRGDQAPVQRKVPLSSRRRAPIESPIPRKTSGRRISTRVGRYKILPLRKVPLSSRRRVSVAKQVEPMSSPEIVHFDEKLPCPPSPKRRRLEDPKARHMNETRPGAPLLMEYTPFLALQMEKKEMKRVLGNDWYIHKFPFTLINSTLTDQEIEAQKLPSIAHNIHHWLDYIAAHTTRIRNQHARYYVYSATVARENEKTIGSGMSHYFSINIMVEIYNQATITVIDSLSGRISMNFDYIANRIKEMFILPETPTYAIMGFNAQKPTKWQTNSCLIFAMISMYMYIAALGEVRRRPGRNMWNFTDVRKEIDKIKDDFWFESKMKEYRLLLQNNQQNIILANDKIRRYVSRDLVRGSRVPVQIIID